MYKIGQMPKSLELGYIGENLFRTVEIDMSAWVEKLPGGVPSIIHIQPGKTEADAYIADTSFDTETNVLSWTITDADLGTMDSDNNGEGEIQIWMQEETDDDSVTKCGKSIHIASIIHKSATEPDDTPPAAQTGWMEQMTALKTATVNAAEDAEDAKDDAVEAKEAAEDAQEAAESAQAAAEAAQAQAEAAALHYPVVVDGYWAYWNQATEQYVKSNQRAQGDPGDPTELIDDTSTGLDKTWSASKQQELKNAIDELNNVCGVGSTTQIIMPTGYKSANYSNAAGTLKFKWENNKLTLKKANGSAGEITTSNASLTIDETLTYEVASGSNDEIVFGYENNSEEDDDAFIGLRFCHKNNLSSYVSARVYIPSGTGTKSVRLTKIAEDYEVNLSDYKYVVIRSIKTETAAGATVYIDGYKKIVASENISDRVTELEGKATELEGEIEGLKTGINLYQNRYEDLGYLNTSTGELNLYSADYIEKTSDFISVKDGDKISIQTWVSSTPKVRIGFFDNLKAFISGSQMPDQSTTVLPDGTYYLSGEFTVPSNAKYIKVSYASYGITGKIMVARNSISTDWSPASVDVGSHVFNIADNYDLIGVAHMGKKNLAPENTEPSFIAAAQNGYQFVEMDVRFTSDNVPVLIHDATINRVARNADGTQLESDVYIKDITYAEALEYDFGIAFNQSFEGTKIMRFEDFIILCKNLGLYPYIEIKNDDNLYTEEQVQKLVDIVDTYRMNEKTTWQSYSLKALVWIKKYRPESRLMMSASPVTNKRIIEVEYLRTAFNETVISADETAENIAMIKPHKMTMHTFAQENEYDDIDPYITSVVSDGTNYETYVRNRTIGS